jgi:hypothetical protein
MKQMNICDLWCVITHVYASATANEPATHLTMNEDSHNKRSAHKRNRDARNCKRGESSVLVHVNVLLTLVLDKTVVSFMPRPLYPRRRGSQYPSDTAWLAKQA